ncbi:Ig-like domain-containing protein [Tellurirhabdus rosea]|uniref:Ig-like domain-containing protein n=1 Tax=Tellurirhabdus rosea TaxID=2674997 RepID=UPI00225060FB|nr:T9SS type A sorting domain-containing protein [Tellurirhabdus rosea]
MNTASGCESPRASITVTVTATPGPPAVTSPVTYCANQPASPLTATGSGTLNWYTTATGGTASATAPTPPTSATGTSNYYVSQTVSGCEGPRATIAVIVNAVPPAPTAPASVTLCQNGSAAPLTAVAIGGGTLRWYGTNASGGTASGTAPTPDVATAGDVTYYVSQLVNGCESPRAGILVSVKPQPTAPTVAAIAVCQNTTPVSLTATASAGGTLNWYGTSATGGTPSAVAPAPPTGTVGTTNYYVSQTGANGCESPRAVLAFRVKATPVAPGVTPAEFCLNQQNVPALTATGSGTLNWYTTATGGTASATAPTPPTSATGVTTYYVSQTQEGCEGPRAGLAVTIKQLPVAPTVPASVTFCQNGASAPLSAVASTSGTLNWYGTNATGGTASPTAPTPVVTSAVDANYYVSQTVNGCEGPRASLPVSVKPQPVAPTVAAITVCQRSPVVALTATATGGGTLNWYGTNPTGGTASSTAPAVTTNEVQTTNYYVSQTGTNSCESPRATLTYRVKPTPLPPGVAAVEYCQNQPNIPALTASASAGTNLNWYGTSETGGSPSASAPVPQNTNPVTTTYFVSQTLDGCESPRAGLAVRIKPLPAAPGVTDFRLCQFDEPRQVSAQGQNLKWFNNFGDQFGSTPVATTEEGRTLVYQVSQTVEGCEGPKATLTVTIQTTPLPQVATPVVYCQNTTAQPLSATGVQGGRFVWTDPYGNVTEVAPVPPTLNATTGEFFYKVAQIGPNGCKSANVNIRFIVNPPPTASVSGPASINLGQPASLTITFTSVPPFSYTLSDGSNGTSDTPQKVVTLTPTQSTLYRVTSVSNVCGVGLPGTNANVNVRIPTITTTALTAGTVCAGTQIQVGFTFTGEFNAGNAFRVQMARDTAFAAPIDISAGTPQAGLITATVPTTAVQGLYYVRVIASNPSIPVPGRRSPTVLDVRALPVATLTGTRDIYEGESAQLSFQFTGDGPWQVSYNDSLRTQQFQTNANPHVLTVTPARTTTFRLTSVANNCGPGTVTGVATIRVLAVLGLEPNPLHTAVQAYPVPVSSELTVDISLDLQQEPAKIQLVDQSGRPAMQTTTRQRQTKLDLSGQPSGLYFLQVQVGEHTTVRKVLKQ